MKKVNVYYNNRLSGILEKTDDDKYMFIYDDNYLNDPDSMSISLTISKKEKIHRSDILFPFFFGLLAEGTNKEIQCRKLKIDENDHFTRLLKTAKYDTIGPAHVEEII
jgi:HipA-like protein